MTYEEYKQAEQRILKQRNEAEKRALASIAFEYESILKPYKDERIQSLNVRHVQKGDTVTDGEKTLLVEHIFYIPSTNPEYEYIEFRGTLLTKALKPKKDQCGNFIQQRYGKLPIVIERAKS